MYEDFKERGIRRTIISFDPFLKREDATSLIVSVMLSASFLATVASISRK